MLNILKVNLKKSLLPDLCTLAIALLIFTTTISQTSLFYETMEGEFYPGYRTIFTLYSSVLALATLFFLFKNFNYNKKKVSCDLYYSLPVTKRELYLTNTLFSVMEYAFYWMVFTVVLLLGILVHEKPAVIEMRYGMIFVFTIYQLLYGLIHMLFVIPFLYYANDIMDSIVFLAFIALIPFLFLSTISNITEVLVENSYITGNVDYLGITWCIPLLSIQELGEHFLYLFYKTTEPMPFWGVTEALCIAGFSILSLAIFSGSVFFLSKDKAERSQEIDRKWFGYRVFIPIFIVLFVASLSLRQYNFLTLESGVFSLVLPFVLMVVHRRNFKIPLSDIIWTVSSPILYLIFVGIRMLF